VARSPSAQKPHHSTGTGLCQVNKACMAAAGILAAGRLQPPAAMDMLAPCSVPASAKPMCPAAFKLSHKEPAAGHLPAEAATQLDTTAFPAWKPAPVPAATSHAAAILTLTLFTHEHTPSGNPYTTGRIMPCGLGSAPTSVLDAPMSLPPFLMDTANQQEQLFTSFMPLLQLDTKGEQIAVDGPFSAPELPVITPALIETLDLEGPLSAPDMGLAALSAAIPAVAEALAKAQGRPSLASLAKQAEAPAQPPNDALAAKLNVSFVQEQPAGAAAAAVQAALNLSTPAAAQARESAASNTTDEGHESDDGYEDVQDLLSPPLHLPSSPRRAYISLRTTSPACSAPAGRITVMLKGAARSHSCSGAAGPVTWTEGLTARSSHLSYAGGPASGNSQGHSGQASPCSCGHAQATAPVLRQRTSAPPRNTRGTDSSGPSSGSTNPGRRAFAFARTGSRGRSTHSYNGAADGLLSPITITGRAAGACRSSANGSIPSSTFSATSAHGSSWGAAFIAAAAMAEVLPAGSSGSPDVQQLSSPASTLMQVL